VTSKWLGETEKNLAAIFDAAEAAHAMLLFDEADSVFGKRTDVKSSNDRHANQETNFLLQRIERFTGVVILTTNHESAIDEAFRRRLAAHVRFPVPEVEERLQLWRTMLPKSAPTVGDLELDDLAEKFEMSGGYIRNAVLRAAFLAAAEKKPISAAHLRYAAHLEYEGMGKISTR
jgi:SpoVK/Ycf46/Vps4 family AAA+-type ATPase